VRKLLSEADHNSLGLSKKSMFESKVGHKVEGDSDGAVGSDVGWLEGNGDGFGVGGG
jgi:hypothetical protein